MTKHLACWRTFLGPKANSKGEGVAAGSGRGFWRVPYMVAAILVLAVHRAGSCHPELIWWTTEVRNPTGRCESSPRCRRTPELMAEIHIPAPRLENKDFSQTLVDWGLESLFFRLMCSPTSCCPELGEVTTAVLQHRAVRAGDGPPTTGVSGSRTLPDCVWLHFFLTAFLSSQFLFTFWQLLHTQQMFSLHFHIDDEHFHWAVTVNLEPINGRK